MVAAIRSMRETFGDTLLELGRLYSDLVVISADSGTSMRTNLFREAFPDRFIDVGLAEQNLLTVAAGMAAMGKRVLVTTHAVFLTMRACEEIRTFVCYPLLNVKLVGGNGGMCAAGREGPTHQALEDLGLMSCLPKMRVYSPTDALECKQVLSSLFADSGPGYLRLSGASPDIFEENAPFCLGKIRLVKETGKDAVIFATGIMVHKAIEAQTELSRQGIGVIVAAVHAIKPIDRETVIAFALHTKAVVAVEDHSIHGGLGSAIAEVIAEAAPSVLRRIGICDCFPTSGGAEELLRAHNMDVPSIIASVVDVIGAKERAFG